MTEIAQDTSAEAQRQALARIIETIKAGGCSKDTQLRISISSGEADIKYLTLPALPDDELESAVQLRVDAETAAVSGSASTQYFIADRRPMGARAVLVMLSSEKLDPLVDFCRGLDFPLDGVEVEATSFFTCVRSGHESDGCAAVLDLRNQGAALHIFGEISPSFSRVLPDPGLTYTESMTRSSPETEDDRGNAPPLPMDVLPAVSNPERGDGPSWRSRLGIRSLGKEIHDTLQYLENEVGGSPVVELVLAGDQSGTDLLPSELSRVLGLPVRPLGLPSFLSRGGDAEVDPRVYGIALGTAYGAFLDGS